jgi:GGDEF domain-containing protein
LILPSAYAKQRGQSVEKIPILLLNLTVQTTLSFGVAAFPSHGDNLFQVLTAVEVALYQVKTKGHNLVVVGQDSVQL